MGKHALLSASDAARWLYCTPAARLTEDLPDRQTPATLEGTLAHALAELKVRQHCTNDSLGKRAYSNRLKKFEADPSFNAEMLRHTDTYLEYIQEIYHSRHAYCFVEKRLDYSSYAPEGFGTADCILIAGEDMWVVDFKYGKGVPVSAEENPQMLLYALGALKAYDFIWNIKTVHLTIVQPRLSNLSEWDVYTDDLLAWGEDFVKPRAKLAWEGKGTFSPSESACRWCGIRATCRAAYREATAVEDFADRAAPTLSPQEISTALERGQTLVKWYKALEEYALGACLDGQEIPGYKAVAGRAIRSFTDSDEAFGRLVKAGVPEDMLYERKPLTLAAVEKLIGKTEFNDRVGDLVYQPPGKPTLVPETDKRPAVHRNDAAEDFGG